ncbi:hypothetical protein [Pseudomonas sp. D3-10]|uniref:hypothetical protein n=1 Tax=Pseudomonas sp. D3-10 TaxID=2817392 RepID=UPI003DA89CD8
MIYTYHVKAYAPDPRGGDNFFTYDGTVDRDEPLSGESEFDALAQGLSDHVFAETSVRVSPNRFVLQQTELVRTQVGKFPSQIQKPK